MKMNPLPYFLCSMFLTIFLACGGNSDPASLFEIQMASGQKQFQQNQKVAVKLDNKKDKSISGVTYSIDGKELPVEKGQVTLNMTKLGDKVLQAEVRYDDSAVEVSKSFKLLSAKAPEVYTYEIVGEYPHDNKAYTQGLEFHDGTLYESTGKKGRSSLRKVDFESGKILQQVDLNDIYFGEGITIMKDKIYMLTWQSGTGFIYDLNSLKESDSFKYGDSKEGWGLTNDGEKIYKSDGTEKIWILNPETLAEEGFIETVTNKSINDSANELEYVDGKIYANVYQKSGVMIIDSESGAIEGVVNFGGLINKVTHHENWNDKENVLNGIAFNAERGTFFVTGKEWDKLFEVQIKKKE